MLRAFAVVGALLAGTALAQDDVVPPASPSPLVEVSASPASSADTASGSVLPSASASVVPPPVAASPSASASISGSAAASPTPSGSGAPPSQTGSPSPRAPTFAPQRHAWELQFNVTLPGRSPRALVAAWSPLCHLRANVLGRLGLAFGSVRLRRAAVFVPAPRPPDGRNVSWGAPPGWGAAGGVGGDGDEAPIVVNDPWTAPLESAGELAQPTSFWTMCRPPAGGSGTPLPSPTPAFPPGGGHPALVALTLTVNTSALAAAHEFEGEEAARQWAVEALSRLFEWGPQLTPESGAASRRANVYRDALVGACRAMGIPGAPGDAAGGSDCPDGAALPYAVPAWVPPPPPGLPTAPPSYVAQVATAAGATLAVATVLALGTALVLRRLRTAQRRSCASGSAGGGDGGDEDLGGDADGSGEGGGGDIMGGNSSGGSGRPARGATVPAAAEWGAAKGEGPLASSSSSSSSSSSGQQLGGALGASALPPLLPSSAALSASPAGGGGRAHHHGHHHRARTAGGGVVATRNPLAAVLADRQPHPPLPQPQP